MRNLQNYSLAYMPLGKRFYLKPGTTLPGMRDLDPLFAERMRQIRADADFEHSVMWGHACDDVVGMYYDSIETCHLSVRAHVVPGPKWSERDAAYKAEQIAKTEEYNKAVLEAARRKKAAADARFLRQARDEVLTRWNEAKADKHNPLVVVPSKLDECASTLSARLLGFYALAETLKFRYSKEELFSLKVDVEKLPHLTPSFIEYAALCEINRYRYIREDLTAYTDTVESTANARCAEMREKVEAFLAASMEALYRSPMYQVYKTRCVGLYMDMRETQKTAWANKMKRPYGVLDEFVDIANHIENKYPSWSRTKSNHYWSTIQSRVSYSLLDQITFMLRIGKDHTASMHLGFASNCTSDNIPGAKAAEIRLDFDDPMDLWTIHCAIRDAKQIGVISCKLCKSYLSIDAEFDTCAMDLCNQYKYENNMLLFPNSHDTRKYKAVRKRVKDILTEKGIAPPAEGEPILDYLKAVIDVMDIVAKEYESQ